MDELIFSNLNVAYVGKRWFVVCGKCTEIPSNRVPRSLTPGHASSSAPALAAFGVAGLGCVRHIRAQCKQGHEGAMYLWGLGVLCRKMAIGFGGAKGNGVWFGEMWHEEWVWCRVYTRYIV